MRITAVFLRKKLVKQTQLVFPHRSSCHSRSLRPQHADRPALRPPPRPRGGSGGKTSPAPNATWRRPPSPLPLANGEQLRHRGRAPREGGKWTSLTRRRGGQAARVGPEPTAPAPQIGCNSSLQLSPPVAKDCTPRHPRVSPAECNKAVPSRVCIKPAFISLTAEPD